MPKEEIVVVESQTLSEELKEALGQYLCDCVQGLKPYAKGIADSAVDRTLDSVLRYIQELFSA